MKLALVLIAAIAIAGAAGVAEAQLLLFRDNFYHGSGYSYDINLNYNSPSRQSGSVAYLTYQERFQTRLGQADDGATVLSHPWEDSGTLNFFTKSMSGNSFAYPWVSPGHNFTESGNLTIEFDVDPLGPGSTDADHFAGIVFGTSAQGVYVVPGSGLFGTSPSNGVGITLTSDGVWAIYENSHSTPLATGTAAAHSGYYHVRVGLAAAAFDGSPALISLSIDAQQVYSYIRASGFTRNYITLAGQGDGSQYQIHVFDNFSVTVGQASTVPGSISNAKQLSDGSTVLLTNKVLYLKHGTFGYIEEQDRSSGIRIEGTIAAAEGQMVSAVGKVETTAGGERYIQLDSVIAGVSGDVKPLGAGNRSLGNSLMDGLYVKVWGKVKAGSITPDSFVITDGFDDAGIRIITSDAPGVTVGAYATVSGAAGLDTSRVIYRKSGLPYDHMTKNVEQIEKNLVGFFPFGVFYHNVASNTPVETQAATNDLFANFKAHNINSILGGGCWPEHREFFINAAETYGLKLVMALGVGYDREPTDPLPDHDLMHETYREQIKNMGSLFHSPAIIGGYGDEPTPGQEQKYRSFISTLYEEDPLHTQFICLVGSTIAPYYAATWPKDVLLYDAYFIGGTNGVGDFRGPMYGGQDLTQHIDEVRGYIHPKDDTPMWIILQAHNDLSYNQQGQLYESLRVPTPVEIRLQTWLALAHGARGISWFMYPIHHQGPGLEDRQVLENNPANYAEVSALGAKMKILGPTLTKLRVTQNIASMTGGGSPYYPKGDVQTLIDESPYRTPFLNGQDNGFDLFGDAHCFADSDASDGSSAQIPNVSSANTVRWIWPDGGFKPGVEYDLYVSAKVRHNIVGYQLPTGNAFTVGVRNAQGSDVVAPTSIPGELSKPMVYRPYKIGTFVPANARYVFVSGVNSPSNYPEVYIDKFYFVEKGDKYLIVANRNCQNWANMTLNFPLSAADKYGDGLIDIVDAYSGVTLSKQINGGTVAFWPNLAPGDGAVFQLRSRE